MMFMKNIMQNVLRNKFIKNVIILASGTAVSQIITLLLIPIITRLYGPEQYGIMGTFMSVLAVLIPIAALTLPTGIVLPKSSNKAVDIIKASIKISLIISMLTLILLFLFYEFLAGILNLNSIGSLLFLIPLVIITAAIHQVLRQWLIRENRFKILSRVPVYESVIIYGSMVIIGLILPVTTVLIILISIKSLTSALIMYISLRTKNDNIFKQIKIKSNNFKKIIKEYRDFPMYRAPQELLNGLSQNLPVMMLAALFGPISAGFYSIARTALSVPSRFIGQAIGDVFYPRIAKAANNNEQITYLIIKSTIILFCIGAIPFGTVILFGPMLFSLVFGSDWSFAGEFARWLSIWLLFTFSNKPSIKALPVISAQYFHLKFTFLSLLTRVIALSVGFYFFQSDLFAIALFSISGALLELFLIIKTITLSKKFEIYNKR